MHFLNFDYSDGDDGVITAEALASTAAEDHPAVLAEAQAVLDWAWRHFPRSHGPVEDGSDWDHDLQVHEEAGGWHAVTLTLTASPRFAAALQKAFPGDA